MSNINTAVQPTKVQRKKKTFPVIARCEGVEPCEMDNVVAEPSIADTLLNIIQSKPQIKSPPIRKKKAITVADVVGGVVNDAPAKKQTKKKNTQPEPVLENNESLPIVESIEPPLAQTVEPVPKVVKKRTPKKKAETIAQPIPEPILENNERLVDDSIEQPLAVEPVAQTAEPAPKVVKKRTPKKKIETLEPTIPEPILENIESLPIVESIEQPLAVEQPLAQTAEPAPKVVKKRTPKKKIETIEQPIIQPILENIESLPAIESIEQPVVHEPQQTMEWFDQQAKQIEMKREPILATFHEHSRELSEEMYHINQTAFTIEQHHEHTPNTRTYNMVNDIISNTLETTLEDDYSHEIMVESLEFNGKLYWIDTEQNVLDKDSFEHVGIYKHDTATIVFY